VVGKRWAKVGGELGRGRGKRVFTKKNRKGRVSPKSESGCESL